MKTKLLLILMAGAVLLAGGTVGNESPDGTEKSCSFDDVKPVELRDVTIAIAFLGSIVFIVLLAIAVICLMVYLDWYDKRTDKLCGGCELYHAPTHADVRVCSLPKFEGQYSENCPKRKNEK